MRYGWLDGYCLGKKGAVKEYKPEWEATRYLLSGKMFAMVGGDKDGRPIITLKLNPLHGEILRSQYEDIFPGYYMNKVHWNSVFLEGSVPDNVLKSMVDESYEILKGSLSKKTRQEIDTL